LEATIKSGDKFPVTWKPIKDTHFHGKTRKTYLEKLENSEAVGAITDEAFSL